MGEPNETQGCFDVENIETTVQVLRNTYPAMALELRNSIHTHTAENERFDITLSLEKVRAILELVSDACFELMLNNEESEKAELAKNQACLEAWLLHAQCLLDTGENQCS